MQQTAHASRTSTQAHANLAAAVQVSWDDLAPHRSYLINYGRRRLQDPVLAEDLVHDVFEAVVTGRASFGGRAALRTWLVGILKHKIIDLVRQRSGQHSLDASPALPGADDSTDDGAQAQHPALHCQQPRPDEVAEQRERLAQALARIAALPASLKRVVELRLLQDQSSAQVCAALRITEQNLYVRLHRARRALAS